MSLSPVPSNAQLHYKPADHSWVSASSAGDYFAQVVLPVNTWSIPPFDNIAITNDGDGNPIQYDYSKNSTVVATLSCTYDGSGYLTNIQQIL
jgi:hypothetical protein